MKSYITNKLFLITFLFMAIGYFYSAAPVHAVVPALRARVYNAVTNAGIAGVWVGMTVYVQTRPCWGGPAPQTRYEKTDSNGYFTFDGIMPVEGTYQNICYDGRLGRMIDTNLDGVNDAQQIPRMPVTCYTDTTVDFYAPRRVCGYDFGCASGAYTIAVVKPVGWGGYFEPYGDLNFNNAETDSTQPIRSLAYYPSVSTVTGKVFIDTSANGVPDAGELGYQSLLVKLKYPLSTYPKDAATFTNANGDYAFPNLPDGTYTASITVPGNALSTTATSQTVNVAPNRTVNFGISPKYTISGSVYKDINNNGFKDTGEANYNGAPSLTASRGTVTTYADGTYTISQLAAGTVTISFTNLPAGYKMTTPLNGPPPSYQVTVGPGCAPNGTLGTSCQ